MTARAGPRENDSSESIDTFIFLNSLKVFKLSTRLATPSVKTVERSKTSSVSEVYIASPLANSLIDSVSSFEYPFILIKIVE